LPAIRRQGREVVVDGAVAVVVDAVAGRIVRAWGRRSTGVLYRARDAGEDAGRAACPDAAGGGLRGEILVGRAIAVFVESVAPGVGRGGHGGPLAAPEATRGAGASPGFTESDPGGPRRTRITRFVERLVGLSVAVIVHGVADLGRGRAGIVGGGVRPEAEDLLPVTRSVAVGVGALRVRAQDRLDGVGQRIGVGVETIVADRLSP
jgi:hypothetical protein